MNNRELIQWLRQKGSGNHHPASEAADLLERLLNEREAICNVCESLRGSPKAFLKQMTDWTKRVRYDLNN